MKKSVYFARPAREAGPIKIGISGCVSDRMRQISKAEGKEMRLLHCIEGNGLLEHALFRCFADIHVRGEWFQPHWRLVGFIEALKSGMPLNEAIDLSDTRGAIFDYSNSAYKKPFARRSCHAVPPLGKPINLDTYNRIMAFIDNNAIEKDAAA